MVQSLGYNNVGAYILTDSIHAVAKYLPRDNKYATPYSATTPYHDPITRHHNATP